MKQLLLVFSMMSIFAGLSAQAVIWQDDFSNGMHGWTTRTTSCSDFSGSNFGVWELTSGTVDGVDVEFGDGGFIWSFASPLEYSISFRNTANPSDASVYGTVYARYEMDGDTLVSDISNADFIASGDGNAFEAQTPNGIVRWATNMELGGDSLALIARLIGSDRPIITFTDGGQNFTYTSQDGLVVLEFSKTTDCGNLWNWSPNGNVGYGIFSRDPGLTIDSDTRQNGVLVVNNLFHSAQGDTGYNPGAPPYPQYVAELISPPIDISGANGALLFEMSEIVEFLNVANGGPAGMRTAFAVSADDGATWSADYDINEGLGTNTRRNGKISIPILINDVNGADEIRVRLIWGTDFYYWGIDDVAIVERIPYEMQANANFFAIATNTMTPASQVEPLYFMSDIQNNGGATAENVNLNMTVVDIANGTTIYDSDNFYGAITPDSLAENSFFVDPLAAELQLPGLYRGTYFLSHDSIDSNPANDILTFEFSVTDTLFAKETGRTRGIFLTNDNAWYIGNSFYVPNGEGLFARYISFMVDNASDVANDNSNGVVTTYLYESDGDLNDDGRIDGEELGNGGSAIAFNDYDFDGTEDREMITIPVDLDGFVPLKNDKYYLAVIQYVGVNEDDNLVISASEEYNYAANSFITDSLGMPRYSDVVDLTDADPSYFRNGFGGTVVPVVRLSIGVDTDVKDHLLSDDYKMLVFPNPVKDQFQLELEMPEQLDVYVRLYDQNGRILFVESYKELIQGLFTYDVSSLAAGTYLLKLSTPNGIKTEEVIVVK